MLGGSEQERKPGPHGDKILKKAMDYKQLNMSYILIVTSALKKTKAGAGSISIYLLPGMYILAASHC